MHNPTHLILAIIVVHWLLILKVIGVI